ncbi:hypothetical protein M422DRAFT_776235 [Sphaerobolus stellatus SS14]|nr:hypothetical protein M422DRAFT_776235 [Sphaerobolus stellatus SS14]
MDYTDVYQPEDAALEDFEGPDSRVSEIGESDYGNVSSTAGEEQLSVKDIVNWRECTDIWSAYHPVVEANLAGLSLDHPVGKDVYHVFQFAYGIPKGLFINTSVSIPAEISQQLTQLASQYPNLFTEEPVEFSDEFDRNLFVNEGASFDIYLRGVNLYHSAKMMVENGLPTDQEWDALYDRVTHELCSARKLGDSDFLENPIAVSTPDLEEINPVASSILQTRRITPHAVIPMCLSMFSRDTHTCACDSFAATVCTRSQIASSLRERSEDMALHTFSLMSAEAILASKKMPKGKVVFGIMCDREIVRFHVDWIDPNLHTTHVSAPLTPSPSSNETSSLSPFKEFNVTHPEDAIKLAFLLTAIRSYARTTAQALNLDCVRDTKLDAQLRPLGEEISKEDKVYAWIGSGSSVAGIEDAAT